VAQVSPSWSTSQPSTRAAKSCSPRASPTQAEHHCQAPWPSRSHPSRQTSWPARCTLTPAFVEPSLPPQQNGANPPHLTETDQEARHEYRHRHTCTRLGLACTPPQTRPAAPRRVRGSRASTVLTTSPQPTLCSPDSPHRPPAHRRQDHRQILRTRHTRTCPTGSSTLPCATAKARSAPRVTRPTSDTSQLIKAGMVRQRGSPKPSAITPPCSPTLTAPLVRAGPLPLDHPQTGEVRLSRPPHHPDLPPTAAHGLRQRHARVLLHRPATVRDCYDHSTKRRLETPRLANSGAHHRKPSTRTRTPAKSTASATAPLRESADTKHAAPCTSTLSSVSTSDPENPVRSPAWRAARARAHVRNPAYPPDSPGVKPGRYDESVFGNGHGAACLVFGDFPVGGAVADAVDFAEACEVLVEVSMVRRQSSQLGVSRRRGGSGS